MSKANPRSARPVPPPPAPQLMLVLPAAWDDTMMAQAKAVLAAAPFAAVVMPVDGQDPRAAIDRIKTMAGPVQAAGAALLIDGPMELAVRGGADGIHLAHDTALVLEAIERLKPERIVGVGEVRSRDDAMTAGEAGADYIWFGPTGGVTEALASVLERVSWWSALFETPVVATAPALTDIAPLVAAGADFIALPAAILGEGDRIGETVARAHALLGAAHAERAQSA